MHRLSFVRNLLGAALLPAATLAKPVVTDLETAGQRVRRELLEAWAASEKITRMTAELMPDELFGFRYTSEAMTFAEQWKHCCVFTVSQLAARLGVANPYTTRPLPQTMTKADVLMELTSLYAFVRKTLDQTPDAKFFVQDDYMGNQLPNWRMIYALENHIIHHRGQCMVYLRLSGITPEGYLGW